jgi:hypothetical protein
MPGSMPALQHAQAAVHRRTAAHVGLFQTALFGKTNIFDPASFGCFQIVLGMQLQPSKLALTG